ncbi:MAG: glycoside hydrolase family 78 protein [Clostridiales bacterium]|nr:glycoside hydrolase family 78 protein [Clostridiales bacterium]
MTDFYFITTERPYTEGAVEVFEQPVSAGAVKKATLTITALGVYESEINGQKIGEDFFAPGYTYYPRHLTYQTYDVTEILQKCILKQNSALNKTDIMQNQPVLRVYLGQGWYCGRFTCDNKTQIYGERPAVSWALEITDVDDKVIRHTSRDKDVTAIPSPYAYAGFYDGEVYNEDTPQTAYPPVPFSGPLPDVIELSKIATRLQEIMPVQSVTKHGDVTILDFGQNFAGIIEINPEKMNSECLTLRHGEILNADGSLYTANLRKAKAQIVYHKSKNNRFYCPRFTYMGFRYVELSGCDYAEGLLTARVLHTEMPRTGYFTCDNAKVQRLFDNQLWGQRSNYIEVPTDCPQRDERMGYTGDGHVFAQTGAFNYDTEAFWDKFFTDIRHSQTDNTEGYVAPTIPAQSSAGVGFINMLGWGNAVTIIPEMLLQQYGTDRYLREMYDSMKAHVDCEIRHMDGKNLWLGANLGDWLAMGKDTAWQAQHNNPISNSFIVHDLKVLSETAEMLGKQRDASHYKTQYEATRNTYMQMFVKEDGDVAGDYQSAYIMALKFVIPEGELRKKVLKKYAENVRRDGLTTGFFATEHLLPLLIEAGETELAYDVLLHEGCPGWMYQINRGATTTWERWDAIREDGTVNEDKMSDDNMVSFNHYAFGSVGEFYYQYILGIKPLEPGFKKVKIQPYPDKRLVSVSGRYLSRAGEIKSAWSYHDDRLTISVAVPTEAEIHLPDERVEKVGAGEYSYEI